MNRNILVSGNPSTLGRYTDLNLLAGSGATLTYVNNDTLKTTDLTIATAPKVVSVTSVSVSVAINADITDLYIITAQAEAVLFSNPTGTLVQGQKLIIRIKDNGTARAITYGANFRASTDLALPTTTTVSKTLYMGFMYNSTDTKWDIIAKNDGF